MNESAASPPASPAQQNWNVALVGQPTATSRALCQVFKQAHVSIHSIHLANVPAEADLRTVRDGIAICKPTVVIAGSRTAWNLLRVLNVWQPVASLFDSAKPSPEAITPPVIPLPGIPESHSSSLFDHFATRDIPVGSWICGFVKALQSRKLSQSVTGEEVDFAISHFLAAKERHDLKLTSRAGSHERNDAMAAIRVIQGARLDGWLEAEVAKGAFEQVLAIATQTPVPNGEIPTDTNSFASIVVADDEGFWGRPLNPIWRRLGFELVHQPALSQVGSDIARLRNGPKPVRVVLLDMQMQGHDFAGAKVLRALRQNHNHVPVVALSVDDQFSETVMLKRLGVFAYLNKHSLAEPARGRDALGAFRQMKDGVLAAGFASLADDFWQLWIFIAQACQQTMAAQPRIGRTETIQLRLAADLLPELQEQVRDSLDVFREQCRRMFHNFWQDSAMSPGVGCRQVIRALGLVNDKWCSMWGKWRFDPDRDNSYWAIGVPMQFPYLAYHKITTAMRNEASHAMLEDDDFDWLDVWIMFLTLFLKMEGTARAFAATNYDRENDSRLSRIGEALRQLLIASGCIPRESAGIGDDKDLKATVSKAFGALITRFESYLQFPFSEVGFVEGDKRRLTVQPYLSAELNYHSVLEGFAAKFLGAQNLSAAQLSANHLLVKLIATRVSHTP